MAKTHRTILAVMAMIGVFISFVPSAQATYYPTVVVSNDGSDSDAQMQLHENGSQAAWVVSARGYASAIGATYHWYPESSDGHHGRFTITYPVALTWRNWDVSNLTVEFRLNSCLVKAYIDGEQWAYYREYNVCTSTGVTPHENADAGYANTIPLRFTNDLFRFKTESVGNTARINMIPPWRTTYGGADLAPSWDTTRIQYYINEDASWTVPDGGSPLLPSTTRRLEAFAQLAHELKVKADSQNNQPYHIDWANFEFQYLTGGVYPAMSVSDTTGEDVVTYLRYPTRTSATKARDSYVTHKGDWDYALGTTTAGLGLAAASLDLYEWAAQDPEPWTKSAGVIVGTATAVTGSVWSRIAAHYDTPIDMFNSCIDAADNYVSDHSGQNPRWSMMIVMHSDPQRTDCVPNMGN